MNVLLFGVLADVMGKSEIETKATDIESLRSNLLTEFPALNQYRFQVVVNRKKTDTNILLSDRDEIALLPPFAGG